jgi:hypothetical protein
MKGSDGGVCTEIAGGREMKNCGAVDGYGGMDRNISE